MAKAEDGRGDYNQIDMEALAKSWDQNPLKAGAITALVAMYEGSNTLLSALAEIDPDFILDPEETDLPALMQAVYDARPHWFPSSQDWLKNPYGMIKEVMREHDVNITAVKTPAVLEWMESKGLKTATAGEIKAGLAAG